MPQQYTPRQPNVTLVCPQCNRSFTAIASRIRQGVRSCSRACRDIAIRKHGLALKVPEYRVWKSLKNRCLNPNGEDYAQYGGRGITVCPEWSDFAVFYRDMGSRPSPLHSIDRIDVNGPYSAENCRWATVKEQQRNRRSNTPVTYRGETMILIEWAERTGINYNALKLRMKNGWTIERALTTPVRARSKNRTADTNSHS